MTVATSCRLCRSTRIYEASLSCLDSDERIREAFKNTTDLEGEASFFGVLIGEIADSVEVFRFKTLLSRLGASSSSSDGLNM